MGSVYPDDTTCLVCGESLPGEVLCPDCRKRLDALRLSGAVCDRCGHPLPQGEACPFCAVHFLPVTARSAWAHKDEARRLVHLLKFHQQAIAADIMARAAAEAAGEMNLCADTVVTWVTMPERRKRERGIDHGYELASRTADLLGLPCRQLLLRRDGRHEITQRGLDGEQRAQNLSGAFSCMPMKGGHVLLLDDVLTTGRTVTVCARALLEAGCESVSVVTATRAVDRKTEL
ncbi:MAG: double zinc ribbon domain-containing protein [Clostridia bacterium]|nr:double zinc ribbon domain-containing protein [Clostridia bacterium]